MRPLAMGRVDPEYAYKTISEMGLRRSGDKPYLMAKVRRNNYELSF
jgi:hypothetical protein